MERIEVLRKQLERMEKRKQDAIDEMNKLSELTYIERLQLEPIRLNQMISTQREVFVKKIKREYKHLKDQTDELFKEYIDLLINQKVKNMNDFLKLKEVTNDRQEGLGSNQDAGSSSNQAV